MKVQQISTWTGGQYVEYGRPWKSKKDVKPLLSMCPQKFQNNQEKTQGLDYPYWNYEECPFIEEADTQEFSSCSGNGKNNSF